MFFGLSPAGLGLAALAIAGAVYLVLCLRSLSLFRVPDQTGEMGDDLPVVSILKPLCGDEPRLYDCLRSFLNQNYPRFQVVFGVREPTDPALATVARLQAEFPQIDIRVVCDARIHGANLKMSNVINMMAECSHPFILVSDSDVEVGPQFLAAAMAEMSNPRLGVLSALYRGRATNDGWVAALGAANITQWIVPSILVDRMLSGHEAGLGPAMLLRRDALAAVGGFESVVNHLAEDCELARRIEAAGWLVRLNHHVVDTMVNEGRLSDLIRHEVRWAHTVRAVRPMDHALSVITCPLPPILALAVVEGAVWAAAVVVAYLMLRQLVAAVANRRMGAGVFSGWWLVWGRECLCFAVWLISMFSRAVIWRGQSFTLTRGGLMVPDGIPGDDLVPLLPAPGRNPAE